MKFPLKLIVYLLFLLPAPIALAANADSAVSFPFTFNNKKDFSINDYNYRRYIQPQIRYLLADARNWMSNLSDDLARMIKIKRMWSDVITFARQWDEQCLVASPSQNCQQQKLAIYQRLVRIEKELLKLWQESATRFLPATSHDRADPLSLFTHLGPFLIDLGHLIDSVLPYGSTDLSPRPSSDPQAPRFQRWLTRLEVMMLKTAPPPLQKDLSNVYFSFFRPLEQNILPRQHPTALERNIEDLNFSWNHFYQKLSRGNLTGYGLNLAQARLQLNAIHNRWNSILKLVL